jgi:hypothetical protein
MKQIPIGQMEKKPIIQKVKLESNLKLKKSRPKMPF